MKKFDIDNTDLNDIVKKIYNEIRDADAAYFKDIIEASLRENAFNVTRFNRDGWNDKGTKIPHEYFNRDVLVKEKNANSECRTVHIVGFVNNEGGISSRYSDFNSILNNDYVFKILD